MTPGTMPAMNRTIRGSHEHRPVPVTANHSGNRLVQADLAERIAGVRMARLFFSRIGNALAIKRIRRIGTPNQIGIIGRHKHRKSFRNHRWTRQGKAALLQSVVQILNRSNTPVPLAPPGVFRNGRNRGFRKCAHTITPDDFSALSLNAGSSRTLYAGACFGQAPYPSRGGGFGKPSMLLSECANSSSDSS